MGHGDGRCNACQISHPHSLSQDESSICVCQDLSFDSGVLAFLIKRFPSIGVTPWRLHICGAKTDTVNLLHHLTRIPVTYKSENHRNGGRSAPELCLTAQVPRRGPSNNLGTQRPRRNIIEKCVSRSFLWRIAALFSSRSSDSSIRYRIMKISYLNWFRMTCSRC
ncbi:hypothetical protein J6590_032844 [Homalodisca vitripennis]|nr:hypothetical protein J6590_032844 [Homalodisca vitripennis]